MIERIDNFIKSIKHSLVGSVNSSLDTAICSLVGYGSLCVFLKRCYSFLKSLEFFVNIGESCDSLGGSLFLEIVRSIVVTCNLVECVFGICFCCLNCIKFTLILCLLVCDGLLLVTHSSVSNNLVEDSLGGIDANLSLSKNIICSFHCVVLVINRLIVGILVCQLLDVLAHGDTGSLIHILLMVDIFLSISCFDGSLDALNFTFNCSNLSGVCYSIQLTSNSHVSVGSCLNELVEQCLVVYNVLGSSFV